MTPEREAVDDSQVMAALQAMDAALDAVEDAKNSFVGKCAMVGVAVRQTYGLGLPKSARDIIERAVPVSETDTAPRERLMKGAHSGFLHFEARDCVASGCIPVGTVARFDETEGDKQ